MILTYTPAAVTTNNGQDVGKTYSNLVKNFLSVAGSSYALQAKDDGSAPTALISPYNALLKYTSTDTLVEQEISGTTGIGTYTGTGATTTAITGSSLTLEIAENTNRSAD